MEKEFFLFWCALAGGLAVMAVTFATLWELFKALGIIR